MGNAYCPGHTDNNDLSRKISMFTTMFNNVVCDACTSAHPPIQKYSDSMMHVYEYAANGT